jgi:hypothetical protein
MMLSLSAFIIVVRESPALLLRASAPATPLFRSIQVHRIGRGGQQTIAREITPSPKSIL